MEFKLIYLYIKQKKSFILSFSLRLLVIILLYIFIENNYNNKSIYQFVSRSTNTLNNKDSLSNNNIYDPNLFLNKCKIKNYEQLRYISIVYTWVNGSLPCYREIRKKHGGPNAIGGSRDREMGELMYSIRSFQKYMSWHEGPIYIVTPGHIPYWLDMKHPRIKVINQDDLFPSYAKKFLPTFNTHVIEQFLYLIPGLSDIYMQINDDYIFAKPMFPHDFFTCDGGIHILQEKGLISHVPPTPKKGIWISSVLNTQQEMDIVFGKEDRRFLKHAPFLYSRKAFARIHQIFDRSLYMTLKSKFRSKPDMNIPLLHHYYMLHQGSKELNIPIETPSQNEMSNYELIQLKNTNMDDVQKKFDLILQNKHTVKIFALNDEYKDMKVPQMVTKFLNQFLPESSEFELKLNNINETHPLTIRKENTCEINEDILPPFDPDNSYVLNYYHYLNNNMKSNIIGYTEIRSIAFINAFIKGIGLGIGLLFGYFIYLKIFIITNNGNNQWSVTKNKFIGTVDTKV